MDAIKMQMRWAFLITATFLSRSISSERVISSPTVTDWGDWGIWEHCPPGMYVTGMQLFTHPSQGIFKDDRGLTGVKLFCNEFGRKLTRIPITSSVDRVGKWGKTYFCPGAMTGFQMRSEHFRTMLIDDTAGNNLRMFCDSNNLNYQEGDGTPFGEWTARRHCGHNEIVCGIRTQVDKSGSWDSTGVNNVKMECCDVPNPALDCNPLTSWENILTCQATSGIQTCNYTRKIGLSFLPIGWTYNAGALKLFEKFGYGPDKVVHQLQAKFAHKAAKFTEDSKESHWGMLPDYVWKPQLIQTARIRANTNSTVNLYQLHGKCGPYQVWGTKLIKTTVYNLGKMKTTTTTNLDFTNENDPNYDYTG